MPPVLAGARRLLLDLDRRPLRSRRPPYVRTSGEVILLNEKFLGLLGLGFNFVKLLGLGFNVVKLLGLGFN
jgi:hypothetical protein